MYVNICGSIFIDFIFIADGGSGVLVGGGSWWWRGVGGVDR